MNLVQMHLSYNRYCRVSIYTCSTFDTNRLLTGRDEELAKERANAFKLRAFDTAIKAIDSLTFQVTPSTIEIVKEVCNVFSQYKLKDI